jgi:hypothetical protein
LQVSDATGQKAPVDDKDNSDEVLPKPTRQNMVANMRTFPITAPPQEAISAAASTGQQASNDTVMNDTESESGEEISAGATLSVPMQEVCLSFRKVVFSIRITFDVDRKHNFSFF